MSSVIVGGRARKRVREERIRSRAGEPSSRGGISVLYPRVHATRGSEGRKEVKQRHAGQALLSLQHPFPPYGPDSCVRASEASR